MRSIVLSFVSMLVALTWGGERVPGGIAEVNFAYTPAVEAATQEQRQVVIVLRPRNTAELHAMIQQSAGQEIPVATMLRDALRDHLVALLRAEGQEVLGPFASVDELTLVDKKRARLVVSVETGMFPDQSGLKVDSGGQTLGTTLLIGDQGMVRAAVSGTCALTGHSAIVAYVPRTMEKIDALRVDAPTKKVDCTFNTPQVNPEHLQPAIMLAALERMIPVYERAHLAIMEKAEGFLAPARLVELVAASQ